MEVYLSIRDFFDFGTLRCALIGACLRPSAAASDAGLLTDSDDVLSNKLLKYFHDPQPCPFLSTNHASTIPATTQEAHGLLSCNARQGLWGKGLTHSPLHPSYQFKTELAIPHSHSSHRTS